ncbi:MAG: ABC transporter permease [Acidobacteriaceae bacterium]
MPMFRRIRNLLHRSQVDREIQEELQSHIEMRIAEYIAAGMSAEQARRDALLRFGNPAAIKDKVTGIDTALSIENFLRDTRYALRQLRKSPGFAITAVLTLALGIGANVVVFSVLNALILRSLEVPRPENLYQVVHRRYMDSGQSYLDYRDYRDRNTTFTGMAAYYGMSSAGLSTGTFARKVWGYDVTGNYFDLLGIQPEVGRFFHADDEHGPGSAPYVVLSDRLWRSQFNGNPGIVGAVVDLDKHPFTVIGVAPRNFHGIERFCWPDYWIPIVNEQQIEGWDFLTSNRGYTVVSVFGRVKPGVTPQQATDNLNAIASQLARQYPDSDEGLRARLTRPGLWGDFSSEVRAFLLGIMLLASLVLLAACVNLASLFGARAADRSRELAIRLAIGSSRWHILRQLLIEALLVSVAGGAIGTLFASALLGVLSRWQPFGDLHEHVLAAPDARVYGMALLLAVASGLLFGLLPARQIWRTDATQAMKSGVAEVAAFRHFSLRDLLLAVQIALCTLLVTASLVAVRGMMRSLHAPLGFQPQDATLAEMDLNMVGINGAAAVQTERRMIEEAERIPGVSAAGTVNFAPLSGMGPDARVYRTGTADFRPSNSVFDARCYSISPGYLQAAGTRLLAGRNFAWRDDAKSPKVVIVNETFTREMFGHAPAIGRHFVIWGAPFEVVGVVDDGKYNSLTEASQPAAFFSLPQFQQSNATLVVRSHRPHADIAAALQHALTGMQPDLPFKIESWSDALGMVLFPARAATVALGIMGLLAAMLAVTGIFGMAAYSVSKRMKELGIRVAMGAQPAQLMRSALGRPLILLLFGSMAGLAMGVLASRLLAQIVYEATPRDPLVLGGVLIIMALLGLLATWIPARRALAIDPAKLLREA